MAGLSQQHFNLNGNRDSLTDPNGNQTQFKFDLEDHMIEQRVATGNMIQYHYNARNLLTEARVGCAELAKRIIFPSCQISCGVGTCTHLDCIDAYHHTCFEICGISRHCYGGNYDASSFFPNLFYDKCSTKMECMQ